jgi:hypothetical protein
LKVDDNGRTYMWQDGKKFYLATRSNVPGEEQAEESYPVRSAFERQDNEHFDDRSIISETNFAENKGSVGMHQHFGSVTRNLSTDLGMAMDTNSKIYKGWTDDTTKYLMGLDGVDMLSEEDLELLRIDDIEGLLIEIREQHASLMSSWVTPAFNGRKAIIGPDQRRLLGDVDVFTPLKSTKLADIIGFVSQFSSLLGSYSIAVMPFDHIALEYGEVGLCYPGVGKIKYKKMAEALAKLLYHCLIPSGIDKTGALDDMLTLEQEKSSPDGYAMLWALLELFIDAFKSDQVQVTWPDFQEEDNIFTFTRNFVLVKRLTNRKTDKAKARNIALLYLQKVEDATGMKYKAAVLQLRAGLESLERNAILPPRFDINKMSHFIAKSAGKECVDRDLYSPAVRRVQLPHKGPSDSTVNFAAQPSAPPTYAEHPQLCQMAPSLTQSTVSTLTPPIPPHLLQQRPSPDTPHIIRHLQGYTDSRFVVNQAYRSQQGQQSRKRPTPNPQPATQNPKRFSTFDPSILCEACEKKGHPACRCYALGMAILIRKYMEADHYDTLKECEENWVQKHTQALTAEQPQEAPVRPLKVLQTFMDCSLLDIDAIDNEMDWDHFRADYGYPGGMPFDLTEAGH